MENDCLPVWLTDQNMIRFFEEQDRCEQGFFANSDAHKRAVEAERYFYIPNSNPQYDTMLRNLNFVYPQASYEKVSIFDSALSFLREVVMVEGADALFSKHYYDIEWDMFLEYDFASEDMRYYRDHFVHQIRNGYFGGILLWHFGFSELFMKAFEEYPQYPAARFIEMHRPSGDQNFGRTVLRKTWFMAAFFHDIGYPLAYHNRSTSKIENYMPYASSFFRQERIPFSEIVSKLSDSYLFQAVDYGELKEQYEKNDHGMLSALCLLFSYYNSGFIRSLKPADYCAIELAAFSIFAHTRKYSIQAKESKRADIRFGRPVFAQDPFAFLLRFCDDLQEWQRVYFYVSDNPNTLICKHCLQPVRRDGIVYTCGCEKDHEGTHCFEKITSFPYKKINYLSVCDSMKIYIKDNQLIFDLDYDYIKLLEIIPINPRFAEIRKEELNKLELIINNQALFPKAVLHYFISNDYRLIKMKLIETYLNIKGHQNLEDCRAELVELAENRIEAVNELLNEIAKILLPNSNHLKEYSNITVSLISEFLTKKENLKPEDLEQTNSHVFDNIYLYKLINNIFKNTCTTE